MIRALLGSAAGNSQMSDTEVVHRVRGGETGLFEILMRRYNQRLYRIIRTFLSDDDEAKDVMQLAYVNAYIHLDQFANQAAFSTWLTRIAVYEALARVRQRRRFENVDTGDSDHPMGALRAPAPDPEQQVFVSELRVLIESAVETLPPRYRAVFVLRDVEGMSTAETAVCLAITEQSVKTRLHRARVLLVQRSVSARRGNSCRLPLHGPPMRPRRGAGPGPHRRHVVAARGQASDMSS